MSGNMDMRTNGNRPKKEGTLVSAYIRQDAYETLLKHCEITGQSKTKAIERAIMKYCSETEENNANQ